MEAFNKICDKNSIVHNDDELFAYMRAFEEKNEKKQLELF